MNQSDFKLDTLEGIIDDRISNPADGSYTNKLFDSGINKIAQKVGVKDESPQILVFKKGEVLSHESHGHITQDWLESSI